MPEYLYDFNPVTHITAGALGDPGHRTFYVQATQARQIVSVVCEKQQVAALAEGIVRFLQEVAQKYPERATAEVVVNERAMELIEPLSPAFRVGQMGLGYDDENDLLVLVVQEIVGEGEDAEQASTARFWARREQMLALSQYAGKIVAAGRPICGNCGQPMDPEGHFCPRRNGHPPIGYIP
jgi:uncharacterized repeat protein (TIGR03847 family)